MVMLGLGLGATRVGLGSMALIKGDQYYSQLRKVMDKDLRALKQFIYKLEESMNSFSKVALQNRHGLGLLFLKEGGLCAALKEQCCFYINHS